eukprot:366522-Chlamydomonas_euryale.AAC.31
MPSLPMMVYDTPNLILERRLRWPALQLCMHHARAAEASAYGEGALAVHVPFGRILHPLDKRQPCRPASSQSASRYEGPVHWRITTKAC